MGSGQMSSSSNAAALPVAAVLEEDSGEEGYAAERESMRAASRRNSTSLLISNSICLSRGVGDHTHYLLFSNATGELQMRREALAVGLTTAFLLTLYLSVQLPRAPLLESLLAAPIGADRGAAHSSQVESRDASLPAHDVHGRLRPPQAP
ncbi:hypothetical protein ON010_g6363 [Phytophthora cinnamomi]|nr:hypothetical protein ON010_g6363 [Phytophthora cinnamomi]